MKKMIQKVSIVIPTKNRKDHLIDIVESITNQSEIPEELIIVDQSDSPQGKKIIEAKWESVKNSRIEYIYDPKIKGLVDAKRVGAMKASNKLICFLDDDLILDDNFIKEIIKPLLVENNIKGACGIFKNYPERNALYKIMYSAFHKGIFSDPRPSVFREYKGYDYELLKSQVLWGGMTIWRAELLEKIKIDSDRGFFMMEDIDYSTRVIEEFGQCLYINPNARVFHKHSELNRGSNVEQEARKIYEYIIYYKKRKYISFATLQLLWLFFGLLMHAIYMSVQQKEMSLLKAYFDGIRMGRVN